MTGARTGRATAGTTEEQDMDDPLPPPPSCTTARRPHGNVSPPAHKTPPRTGPAVRGNPRRLPARSAAG